MEGDLGPALLTPNQATEGGLGRVIPPPDLTRILPILGELGSTDKGDRMGALLRKKVQAGDMLCFSTGPETSIPHQETMGWWVVLAGRTVTPQEAWPRKPVTPFPHREVGNHVTLTREILLQRVPGLRIHFVPMGMRFSSPTKRHPMAPV